MRIALLLLLFVSVAHAEVNIKSEDHIQNNSNGLCAWCSVETLGRTHGWDTLKGLTASKTVSASHDVLLQELKSKKVTYRSVQIEETEWWYFVWYEGKEGSKMIGGFRSRKEADALIASEKKEGSFWISKEHHYKSQFVWDAIKQDLGAAVTIDQYGVSSNRHMLVIVDVSPTEVTCVDSNYSPGKLRKIRLDLFMKWWYGFAVVIEKKK